MGTLYPGPPGHECQESGSVECDYRHCSDPAYCPCLNYDDLSGQRCEEDSFEEFYPDMSDCASFLNCTGGCIEKVLVRRINISYVKNNILSNVSFPQCQENYLYSVENEWCSYPIEINCGTRPCDHQLYPDRCNNKP